MYLQVCKRFLLTTRQRACPLETYDGIYYSEISYTEEEEEEEEEDELHSRTTSFSWSFIRGKLFRLKPQPKSKSLVIAAQAPGMTTRQCVRVIGCGCHGAIPERTPYGNEQASGLASQWCGCRT